MNKIAKHIVKEDKIQQTYKSVKLGFLKAMAENGFTLSETEALLSKTANIDIPALIQKYSLGLIGLGAVGGVGTAIARRKLEKIVDGTENQEMRQTAKKVEAYKKMLANYRDEAMINQNTNSIGSI
jgi:hypothetical protein